MLTHLKIDGFKNLLDVDVAFGPFNCIAGPNGVGKSNLFDAIRFLSALTDRPLVEAALSVRSEGSKGSDPRSIFFRQGDEVVPKLSLEAEMLVPERGVDDLGQRAKAAITFLRYRLDLEWQDSEIKISAENLTYITQSEARGRLGFAYRPAWFRSVVRGRRTAPFISTKEGTVLLHQDLGEGYLGGGRPRPHVASRLPRTVLSTVNAAENATAVLARREMQSWRLLQLEPSALRAPDAFTAPRFIDSHGAHLPATLARLAGIIPGGAVPSPAISEPVQARVANRLASLIEGVRSVQVEVDDRRELLTLTLTDDTQTSHEARSLSDGTLRFLALAIIESDPEATGVLCLEEPENGIHPLRVPAMLELLEDIAVDPELEVGDDNPLRQVVLNTHSPDVVAEVGAEELLVATSRYTPGPRGLVRVPDFQALSGTWRQKSGSRAVAQGLVYRVLDPRSRRRPQGEKRSRVIDREEWSDLQQELPY